MMKHESHTPPLLKGLSARLLILTVFFVMMAEIMIWTPSVSRFRKVYLEDHLQRAHLSTLALEAMPDKAVAKDLEAKLLFHADAYGIVLKHPDRSILMVSKDMPPKVDKTIVLAEGNSALYWVRDAFETLLQTENRILRVKGISPKNPLIMIEILIDEAPLRTAMLDYSSRIFELSLVISLFTAGLVYLSLHWLMVRPLRRLTRSMVTFREAPEDETRIIQGGQRSDELGIAQRQLAVMQNDVRMALSQKNRLATLGAAVAKINHDLRNSLATTVLAFDQLAEVDDPEVKHALPIMYKSVDRAVRLCSQTLSYVSNETPQLNRSHFHLQELVIEVAAELRAQELDPGERTLENTIDFEIDIRADRQQLFRALVNLTQNAFDVGARAVKISAHKRDGGIVIDVSDNGPGLTARAEKNLFKPFEGSSREGGTGLGLVIVQDVLKAHGGRVSLFRTSDEGTVFRLELPARP